MTSPLHPPLQQLRRRARRVLLVRGLGLCLAAGLVSTAAAVGFDWLVRLDDSGHRGLVLVSLLLAHLVAAWHWLIAPLTVPLSDLALAIRVERRFPELQDQLSSGLQFSSDVDDHRVGSPRLKRQVIDSAVEALDRIDIDTVVAPQAARRAALVASGLAALGLALAFYSPLEAGTGLGRLFLLSEDQWPRQVDLQFLDSTRSPSAWDATHGVRLPAGESIELVVANSRGVLPDDAIIEIRRSGVRRRTNQLLAAQSLERSTRSNINDPHPNVGTTVLTPPDGFDALEFRARGGDDETPWIPLAIAPPPLLESLEVVLLPPAYSDRPTRRLPEGSGDIKAWIGTRAEITAVINQRVRRATLLRGDEPPLPVSIAADGRTLRASFTVATPGVSDWWLSLVDRDGLTAERPERFELRGLADRLPEIEIVEPSGNIQATPRATVQLEVTARDDLGLTGVHLVIREINAPESTERRVRLHEEYAGDGLLLIDHSWRLDRDELVAGMEFDFHVEAGDACDLDTPRVARSTTRTLTIVTPTAKRDQLDAGQRVILKSLGRILARQRTARTHITLLEVQWRAVGRLRADEREILLATEIHQQQFAAQLADVETGLARRARQLIAERFANRIDDPAATRDLDRIATDLEGLGQRELPELESALTDARRRLDDPSTIDLQHLLLEIGQWQDRVISTLQSLIEDLAPAQTHREQLGEIRVITERQQQLLNDTASRPEKTLDMPADQLTRQQQADLRRMARQQLDLADRLDRLGQQIAPAGSPGTRSKTLSPELAAAHGIFREAGIVAAMRESAGEIERNHLGAAQQAQQLILEYLARLERSLQGNVTTDDQTRLVNLDRLITRIEQLAAAQSTLRAETRSAIDQSVSDSVRQRLENRQEILWRDTLQSVDSIRRLELAKAQAIARRAADSMRRAADVIRQPAAIKALSAQASAIEQLESLQRLLAEQRKETSATLAEERTRRSSQDLSRLFGRQDRLARQTHSLDAERERRGRWTRPLLKQLRELAERQQKMIEDTQAVHLPGVGKQDSKKSPETITGQMRIAADSLRRRQTGTSAQQAQQQALVLLDRWLDRLRAAAPGAPKPKGKPKSPSDPIVPQASGPPDRNARPDNSPMDASEAVTGNPGSRPAGRAGQAARVGEVAGAVRSEALRRAPWGDLPPSLRRRLSQSGRERTPDRYSELVRRYYESLAGSQQPRDDRRRRGSRR